MRSNGVSTTLVKVASGLCPRITLCTCPKRPPPSRAPGSISSQHPLCPPPPSHNQNHIPNVLHLPLTPPPSLHTHHRIHAHPSRPLPTPYIHPCMQAPMYSLCRHTNTHLQSLWSQVHSPGKHCCIYLRGCHVGAAAACPTAWCRNRCASAGEGRGGGGQQKWGEAEGVVRSIYTPCQKRINVKRINVLMVVVLLEARRGAGKRGGGCNELVLHTLYSDWQNAAMLPLVLSCFRPWVLACPSL